MTTKAELQVWIQASNAYRNGNLDQSFQLFRTLDSYSKICFNLGMIHSNQGNHDSAHSIYTKALQQDEYMVVAKLQKGYSHYMLSEYECAKSCFAESLKLLLANDFIDYTQLGLKYKIYRCELIFNLALCSRQLNESLVADQYIVQALKLARNSEHKIAFTSPIHTQELFSVPLTCIFEVLDIKAENLQKRSFLKNAKLVVSHHPNGVSGGGFNGFGGAIILDPSLEQQNGTLRRKKIVPVGRSNTLPNLSPLKPVDSDTQYGARTASRKNDLASKLKATQSLERLRSKSSSDLSLFRTLEKAPQQYQVQSMKDKRSRVSSLPARKLETSQSPPPEPEYVRCYSDSGFEDNIDGVKIKIHANKSTKSILVSANIHLDYLLDLIQQHLEVLNPVNICFVDGEDDSTMISITDQEDLEMAFGTDKVVHLYCTEQNNSVLDFYNVN